MTKLLLSLLFFLTLPASAFATEITAPEVPRMGSEQMPQNLESFDEALRELMENSRNLFQPEMENALEIGSCILLIIMLFSLLSMLTKRIQPILSISGAASVAVVMFQHTNLLILYASNAVQEICEYGKLLCPVLTMALAAQGAVSASTALYTGTTMFISGLSILVSRIMLPMVYLFLIFSISNCAFGDGIMKNLSSTVKQIMTWLLKTMLIVFITYMSITGVVSGTTDAAALKATKVTISSVVPVVGGILSDASESVLVSMGIIKNSVGIYGIFAVLAVFMGPFIKIGTQYLVLKITAMVCTIFGTKNLSALIDDFSSAMGLLLAMVAAGSLLILISTVCFMKGIG